jgi:alpha-ribazole phosphatase
MNRLILIRHGRTAGSDRRLYYGAADIPLTKEGLAELEASRAVYPPAGGCRVYTTGLLRTEQTLRAIFGDVPHGTLPGFREINFGIFEMKSYDELKDRADYQAWLAGDWYRNVPPGGESFAQAEARAVAALRKLQALPEDACVVAHGGTAVAVMGYLFPEEGKNQYEWVPQPGGGYDINLKNHEYRVFSPVKI